MSPLYNFKSPCFSRNPFSAKYPVFISHVITVWYQHLYSIYSYLHSYIFIYSITYTFITELLYILTLQNLQIQSFRKVLAKNISSNYNRPPTVDAQIVNCGIFKLAGLIYTKKKYYLLISPRKKKCSLFY